MVIWLHERNAIETKRHLLRLGLGLQGRGGHNTVDQASTISP